MFFFPNSPFMRSSNTGRTSRQNTSSGEYKPISSFGEYESIGYGDFIPIGYGDFEPISEFSNEELLSVYEYEDFIPIYKNEKSVEKEAISKSDILIVDGELVNYFKNNPDKVYELSPRQFEELVAGILTDLGYSVELTAQSADGGIDIFATQKSVIGESLLIVDCKRYAPNNRVGVEIVRSIFGICEQRRATMAMIATTSFFTKPAQEFQKGIIHRLSLKDYNDLGLWLSNYGCDK